jgi:hypothetical protein
LKTHSTRTDLATCFAITLLLGLALAGVAVSWWVNT